MIVVDDRAVGATLGGVTPVLLPDVGYPLKAAVMCPGLDESAAPPFCVAIQSAIRTICSTKRGGGG